MPVTAVAGLFADSVQSAATVNCDTELFELLATQALFPSELSATACGKLPVGTVGGVLGDKVPPAATVYCETVMALKLVT